MKYVWVVTVLNESGDNYAPWLFAKKPTQKILEAKVRSMGVDGEDSEGPGAFNSYLYLSKPQKLPVE